MTDPGARLAPPREGVAPLAASGLLLGLAHPPFHLLLPSFVALVPFLVWLGRLPPGPEGRSRALRGGFFLGVLYFTLVLHWLVTALIPHTPLAVLAFLVPVLALAGLLALAAAGIHGACARLGAPAWLAAPVFWTAAEWTRAHLGPLAFPWMELGTTLTGYPRLIGAADLVGTRGLSFWLVLVNALLAVAWERGRRGDPGDRRRADASARWRRLRAPLAGLLVVLAVPVGYSLHRWTEVDPEPAARVVVVQPDLPEELALGSARSADSARAVADALLRREEIVDSDPDLVVLPETVFPVPVDARSRAEARGGPDPRSWAARTARRLDAALLYGAVGTGDRGPEGAARYNSAFLVSAAGSGVDRYDKRDLVPVAERLPWAGGGGFPVPVPSGGYAAGEGGRPLEAAGARFGVLICYESIFAARSRRYRRQGAAFLVNMTNDAWFGREEPRWRRTSALWQHPAHLVMRAVENRVGAVRSANTGISGLVDPLGRFRPRTELFRAAAFAGTVYTTDERTLFTRWGDWVGAGSALLALAAVVTSGLIGRRRGAGSRRKRRPRREGARTGRRAGH